MRPQFVKRRLRGASLSAVPPSPASEDYSTSLAEIAAHILYKSPLPSNTDLPIYILNAAAFPDAKEVNYDRLLSYVLARLPEEDELLGGNGYEVVFFAGGEDRDRQEKRKRPSFTWTIQAYNVLSRAMRKRLQTLYLVHERKWVRVLSEMFSTKVSPKIRRKVVHASSLSALALHLPIEDLLIPPSAYYRDRKVSPDIYVPYASGRRAFKASHSLPKSADGSPRLPRVLREATSFLLAPENIKTEGLFRVNARAITLEVLREAYDRGQKFIVWREGKFVMTFHQWKEGFGDVTVNEVDQIDGYSVYAAAGLIKSWYSDLKEPIFPESSYAFLERTYGDQEVTVDSIFDLIGDSSEWSPISRSNRQALRMHLLPTLSAICKHKENKMTAKSLGVCFAPSLLYGSDPMEDAKMCGLVGMILEFAIEHWEGGLQELCAMSESKFLDLLKLPKAPEDREDPLDKETRPGSNRSNGDSGQTQGILLVDHQSSSDEDEHSEAEGIGPPLPPRNRVDSAPPLLSTKTDDSLISPPVQTESPSSQQHPLRRKPAPAQGLPRAFTEGATGLASTIPEDLSAAVGKISLDPIKAFEKPEKAENAESTTNSNGNMHFSNSPLSPVVKTPSSVTRKALPLPHEVQQTTQTPIHDV